MNGWAFVLPTIFILVIIALLIWGPRIDRKDALDQLLELEEITIAGNVHKTAHGRYDLYVNNGTSTPRVFGLLLSEDYELEIGARYLVTGKLSSSQQCITVHDIGRSMTWKPLF